MSKVLGNISYDIDFKVKNQIMYFLLNATPKPLDVAISNSAHSVCIGHMI